MKIAKQIPLTLALLTSAPAFAHIGQCVPPENSVPKFEIDHVPDTVGVRTVLKYFDEDGRLSVVDGPMKITFSAGKTTYEGPRFTLVISEGPHNNLFGRVTDRLGEVEPAPWFCSVLR